MKRFFAMLGALVCSALVLAGCGGSPSAPVPSASPAGTAAQQQGRAADFSTDAVQPMLDVIAATMAQTGVEGFAERAGDAFFTYFAYTVLNTELLDSAALFDTGQIDLVSGNVTIPKSGLQKLYDAFFASPGAFPAVQTKDGYFTAQGEGYAYTLSDSGDLMYSATVQDAQALSDGRVQLTVALNRADAVEDGENVFLTCTVVLQQQADAPYGYTIASVQQAQ